MPNITGASGEVTIGEHVYTMSPITDRDIGDLNIWLRAKMIAAARESIPSGANQRVEDNTMSVAMRVASKMDWLNDPSTLTMPENLLRLIWQLMRKRQPDLTSEVFYAELLADKSAIVKCRDMFRALHPMLMGDEKAPDVKSPPQRVGTTGTKSTQPVSTKEKRQQKKRKRQK